MAGWVAVGLEAAAREVENSGEASSAVAGPAAAGWVAVGLEAEAKGVVNSGEASSAAAGLGWRARGRWEGRRRTRRGRRGWG